MMNIDGVLLEERKRLERALLSNIHEHAPELRRVLENVNDGWCYEDCVSRFYHQSFKVFELQNAKNRIVDTLKTIAPEARPFCSFSSEIVHHGTGRTFSQADNQHWLERAAPIVQAFLHARYFLEMAAKYAAELAEPPELLPSGWAALLCLYGLR